MSCMASRTCQEPYFNFYENLYLPSAVFIAQVLVGPSKQLKQILNSNVT